MAQRDKIKELVGRGLNSYHTKALQQMDRIEKKNKEQNHKISILSNELDNDYLTKTEEGSVVSLEHSKEGMVYLDELQGNTLVNYCTDGSRELTLNGDIDVEGTFVTTTEGVDNGKVDVVCEGNTLVALASTPRMGNTITLLHPLTTGKEYTLLFTTTKQPTSSQRSCFMLWRDNQAMQYLEPVDNAYYTKLGSHRIKFIAQDAHTYLGNWQQNVVGELEYSNVMLLEGDWTNRELPSYFEGMKSVGQDDENGHKIEILSQNKNLLKNPSLATKTSWEVFNGTIVDGVNGNKGVHSEYVTTPEGYYNFLEQLIFSKGSKNNIIKTDRWYTFSFYAKGTGKVRTHIYPNTIDTTQKGIVDGVEKTLLADGNYDWNLTDDWVKHTYTFKSKSDLGIYSRLLFRLMPSGTDILNTATISCPMLEEGKVATNFVDNLSNKKEILMNEPLRSLPDGTKDKIVKINGKWFIERNTIYCDSTIDNFNITTETQSVWGGETTTAFRFDGYNFKSKGDNSLVSVISDSVVCVSANDGQGFSKTENEYLCLHSNGFIIGAIKTSKITSTLTEYFRANSLKFITKRNTPIYEPLEVEPTLNTYNDVTHISNNSIIPCNMKIKNSGYNAIIKPSTLYTVALDTYKSGTIGMNLGGAKGTTTNNVLKLTTPATLTDDSLRLYGKGIKGSKVRLLEGDKTNWIPSHFEGMKSSFEDKFDVTDNTYKMEILSNNKNLFDINGRFVTSNNVLVEKNNDTLIISNESGQANWQQHNIFIRGLQHNKTYLVNIGDLIIQNNFEQMDRYAISIYEETRNLHLSNIFDANKKQCRFSVPLGARLDKISLRIHITTNSPIVNKITVKNIQISEVDSCIIDRKFNKIQFSSIEPLRSLPSGVKDKFIFKNGKLMIERNTSKTKITSDMNFARSYDGWFNIVFACEVDGLKPIDISTENVYCNILPYFNIAVLCNALGRTGVASHNWINNMNLQIAIKGIDTVDKLREWISERDMEIVYQIEPTYEEVPFELQKIILEGYENGTLFFDTNIPPTSTVTYAGEIPIVKSVKLNKTEVSNNTDDINDNIIPYLMDMDYRVVCLQLQSENINDGVSMARLFGGAYEMLQRDIQSKRYSVDEYKHRLDAYLDANKITEEEYNKLGDMLNE